jgi:hypothetical protein
MFSKHTFGYISVFIVLVTYLPYFYSIVKGKTRPHLFSWLNWTLLTGISGVAGDLANAGAGAWSTELDAVFCFFTVFFCLSHGEKKITKSDWLVLFLASAVLPFWFLTDSLLVAVSCTSFINLLGYYSTFRKSYYKPGQEMVFSYCCCIVQGGLMMLATEAYSWTTLIYPVSSTIVNVALISMLMWRRQQMEGKALRRGRPVLYYLLGAQA